jgi:signal transduction histidine kinase
MAPPPESAQSFGFGRRVAALFGVVMILFVILGLVVSSQLRHIHAAVDRVLEEQRENDVSAELAHQLRSLRRHLELHQGSGWSSGSPAFLVLQDYASDSVRLLEVLKRGPAGDDPSEGQHQSEEARVLTALELELAALNASSKLATAAPPLPSTVDEALRLAEVLSRSMYRDGNTSANELYDTARRMRSAVLWVTGVALVVLLGVLVLVQRAVIRPVERLRQGVTRLAGGDLSHRVDVSSKDELGELAREFNRMATELEGMHRELERRVEERTREFLRAARLAGLGTISAGIAHEINNPLASIAACAEGLERKLRNGPIDPEQQREYLQVIAKEAYRAHEITSRLLEFARGDSGASVPFSLSDLLREIDVLLEHRLRARRLSLEVACDPAMPVVHGDPSECKQVLLNLISNAIDASPPGGSIRVACKRSDDETVLEVEDHGPGIPPDTLERVFDPFFTTKAPGKGTGLGLAIVHRIVEGRGGRIEVENTGTGALFRVRIPMTTAQVA